jgi:hypothetical protein
MLIGPTADCSCFCRERFVGIFDGQRDFIRGGLMAIASPEEEPEADSPRLRYVFDPSLPLRFCTVSVFMARLDRNQNPFAFETRGEFFFSLFSVGPAGFVSAD